MTGDDAKQIVDALLAQPRGEDAPAGYKVGEGPTTAWVEKELREVVSPKWYPGKPSRRTVRRFVWGHAKELTAGKVVWLAEKGMETGLGILEEVPVGA